MLAVHVVPMVPVRHEGVASVTADDDVRRTRIPRDAIRRGVRLQCSAMRLYVQPNHQSVNGFDSRVDPWRHLGDWTGDAVWEQQFHHDGLHPGRAALRWSAHEDVVRARNEVLPPSI